MGITTKQLAELLHLKPQSLRAALSLEDTFTAAPWRRVGHRTLAAGTGPDRATICELYSWGDCTEADGNEALIEAAPELYAAASEVFALLDAGVLTVGPLAATDPARVAVCGRALNALQGALSKAAAAGRPAS